MSDMPAFTELAFVMDHPRAEGSAVGMSCISSSNLIGEAFLS
jgi:hypothetical protein